MSQTIKGTSAQNPVTVTVDAIEQRIRRHLRQDGLQLRKNRPGTIVHRAHGAWMVIDPQNHTILYRDITLPELARQLGVLAADEMLEQSGFAGWAWRVIREHIVTENGRRVIGYEPLAGPFADQAEAYRVAAEIGGQGIGVHGAAPKEGTSDE